MAEATTRISRDILNEPPPAADLRLAYGPEPLQFGDLRVPIGTDHWPLAIVVHGGSWRASFSLIHSGHLCEALKGIGIATWNVEYRKIGDPGGGWPTTFEDVLSAIAYVPELPLEHGAVAMIGHSAGGHLALLAAPRVKLPVVAIAAASDFDGWMSDGAKVFLAGVDRAVVSPRRQLPLGVHQVLVHGTDDDVVPLWLSERYVEAAEAAGDDAELVTLEGDGHFEPVDPQAASWSRVEQAIRDVLSDSLTSNDP